MTRDDQIEKTSISNIKKDSNPYTYQIMEWVIAHGFCFPDPESVS
jgi:hypothetical protein